MTLEFAFWNWDDKQWQQHNLSTRIYTCVWLCARVCTCVQWAFVLSVAISVSFDPYPWPDFIVAVFCIGLHYSSPNDDGFESNKPSPCLVPPPLSTRSLSLSHTHLLNCREMYVTLLNLSQIRLSFHSWIKPQIKKKLLRKAFHLQLLRLAYFVRSFCSTIIKQHRGLLHLFIAWTFLTMWIFNAPTHKPADWVLAPSFNQAISRR